MDFKNSFSWLMGMIKLIFYINNFFLAYLLNVAVLMVPGLNKKGILTQFGAQLTLKVSFSVELFFIVNSKHIHLFLDCWSHERKRFHEKSWMKILNKKKIVFMILIASLTCTYKHQNWIVSLATVSLSLLFFTIINSPPKNHFYRNFV